VPERWREPISTIPAKTVLDAKAKQGWRPVAIEWVRDAPEPVGSDRRPIPYGLRVSPDCAHLEVDPVEREVMSLIIAMIAGDHPLSKIAVELNRRELRPREGSEWTQTALFKMLPRVVEFGPEILSAEGWPDNKRKVLSAVS
jgi:hypothetical protein